METESFLNSCFIAKNIHHQTPDHILKYDYDPKLKATCCVMLEAIDIKKFVNSRPSRKNRVYKITSDSEEEKTTISKKTARKMVPIPGKKRLFRQSESDYDDESCQIPARLNTVKSSEFVAEKSLNTPEGLHVVEKTTSSSVNNRIKSLKQYKEIIIEEITISSDEEEEIPQIYRLTDSIKPDCPSDGESSTSTDREMPSITTPLDIPTPVTSGDETYKDERKLQNIVENIKLKKKEKKTKYTKPKNFIRKRGNNKKMSMRSKLQEQQDLTSYCTTVKQTNQKNRSHITPNDNFQSVAAIGNKPHDPIPIYKPSLPKSVPVKAKYTETNRFDKLAADVDKSINERKGPSNIKEFSKCAEKIKKDSPVPPKTGSKNPHEDPDARTITESSPNEISPSFKPPAKRIAKDIGTGATRLPTRRPSVTANLYLNTINSNHGRFRDGSYGTQRVKRVETN